MTSEIPRNDPLTHSCDICECVYAHTLTYARVYICCMHPTVSAAVRSPPADILWMINHDSRLHWSCFSQWLRESLRKHIAGFKGEETALNRPLMDGWMDGWKSWACPQAFSTSALHHVAALPAWQPGMLRESRKATLQREWQVRSECVKVQRKSDDSGEKNRNFHHGLWSWIDLI